MTAEDEATLREGAARIALAGMTMAEAAEGALAFIDWAQTFGDQFMRTLGARRAGVDD